MSTAFETHPNEAVYTGTLDAAFSFETSNIGVDNPATLIRSDQDWGVHVQWTMSGSLVQNLDEEFRVTLYLEDLSPADKDVQLGPIPQRTNPTGSGGPTTEVYQLNIKAPAGTVPVGLYKPNVLIQMFDNPGTGAPWPVACFAELPIINIYQV